MPADAFRIRDLLQPKWRSSLFAAFGLLALSLFAEYIATMYEIVYLARPTSVFVGDLILDNIPVIDLSLLIIDGAVIFIVLLSVFLYMRPRYVPFTVKALALFILTRAFFTSLTHMGIYPESITPGVGIFDSLYVYLNLQSGFFFSGHTGMPFLLAVIFWRERNTRAFFLFLSFVSGVAVLFAHVHYSIDVLAAPFMAFGIYHLAARFFPRDHSLIPKPKEKVYS